MAQARAARSREERNWRRAIGIALAMWACGFFVARVENATRPELAGVSALFVVAFALPSYASLWRWAGRARALQVLVVLGAFAIAIESVGVATGWPYGRFSYGAALGGKVLGLVPWNVPFAWTPLVLGTFALAARLSPPTFAWRVAAGTLGLVLADLVLDPGAVRQKFWAYEAGGLYYGVPASNYFGWIVSGIVGHALVLWLLRNTPLRGEANPGAPWGVGRGLASEAPPAGLCVSLAWTLAFWSSVCAWAGLWIPAAIGHALLLGVWLLLKPDAVSESP